MNRRAPYRILIVDDDPKIRAAHERVVTALGYEAETASDGIEALAKLALDIDMVLLDGDMPNMDGFEVAKRIRGDEAYSHLPIVMVTGLTRTEDRRHAIEVGVNDFVNKPVDVYEFGLRAKWLLELKTAHDRLAHQRQELTRAVDRKTQALRIALEEMTEARRLTYEAHLDTIRRLMIAAEYRDHDTAGHTERIGLYSQVVARALGMSPGDVELVLNAAPMHDVGKLGVPDSVLLKPGCLDETELALMREHPKIGAEILAGSSSPVIQLGAKIALTHHEKWDGSGYPNGLVGAVIPLEGRVCAIVDFFDALTMDRPYRAAVPRDQVLAMMREESGRHFDPEVLKTFFAVIDDVVAVQARHR